MAFDITTARPVEGAVPTRTRRFDISTARPYQPSAAERTEKLIGNRPSALASLRSDPLGAALDIGKRNLMSGRGLGGLPMDIAQGLFPAAAEAVESVPANVGLAAQRGSFQGLGPQLLQGISGQRPAQLGDIIRASGLPEPISNLLAPAIGLASTAGIGGPASARAASEVVGVGARVAAAPLRPIRRLGKTLSLGRPSTILKPNPQREAVITRVRNRLLKAPKLAGKDFESGLDALVQTNPEERVDLSGSLQKYLEQAQKNPAFKSLIQTQASNNKESAFIQSLINQPEVSANLTLKESQAVKQVFSRAIKQKFQQVDPNFWGAHLDALETWHDIRKAQLSAFPQFKGVLSKYSKSLDNFRAIKNSLKEGALESKLMSNFGKNSELIGAFRDLATEDTLKLVSRLQKSTKYRGILTKLGIGAGVLAASQTPPGKAATRVVGRLLAP